MLRHCLIGMLGIALHARSDVRFAPGVLVEEDHPVWISSDKVTLSIEFENLGSARAVLEEANSKVMEIKMTLDDIQTKRNLSETQKRSLVELNVSAKRVQGTIAETFKCLPECKENERNISSNRQKRVVHVAVAIGAMAIATIGAISVRSLVQVGRLEEKLKEQGRVLNSLRGKDEKLEKSFRDLRKSCNALSVSNKEIKEELDISNVLFSLHVILLNIEKETESLMSEIQSQIEAVIAASQGKIAEGMLPLAVLQLVMKDASYEWGANVIFMRRDLYKYYGIMKVKLSDRGLVVEIPVSTMKPFNSYIIRPFPNTYGKSVVKWTGIETMCILGEDFQSWAVDYQIGCVLLNDRYICDSDIFVLETISFQSCESKLIQRQTPTDCKLQQFNEPHQVLMTQTTTVIFCTKCQLLVRCGDNESSWILHGARIFDRNCRIILKGFMVLSIKVFNTDTKVYMKHLRQEHIVITIPPTIEAVTVPELEEDEEKDEEKDEEENEEDILWFIERYTVPVNAVTLLIIALLLSVAVIKKLCCTRNIGRAPVTELAGTHLSQE